MPRLNWPTVALERVREQDGLVRGGTASPLAARARKPGPSASPASAAAARTEPWATTIVAIRTAEAR